MNKPPSTPPEDLNELTTVEFAQAEIATYLTRPRSEAGVPSPVGQAFFDAVEEEPTTEGITSLTQEVIGNDPSIIGRVAVELSDSPQADQIDGDSLASLARAAEKVYQPAVERRREIARDDLARRALSARMRRAGHGAEPILPVGDTAIADGGGSSHGAWWRTKLDYEGTLGGGTPKNPMQVNTSGK